MVSYNKVWYHITNNDKSVHIPNNKNIDNLKTHLNFIYCHYKHAKKRTPPLLQEHFKKCTQDISHSKERTVIYRGLPECK